MNRIVKLLALILLLATGCGQPAEVLPGTGAVETPAARVSGVPLASVLAELEAKLDSTLDGGASAASERRLAEAESITDRLIETELPFSWLGEGRYSVEARLRQIQALADRVMAEARGADRAALAADVQAFRDRVHGLREDLANGGVRAPTPVRDLLQAMDTLRR